MNQIERETFQIIIEVMDMNEFAKNSLIGTVSIGLGNLYRNANHEFFQEWFELTHPSHGLEN